MTVTGNINVRAPARYYTVATLPSGRLGQEVFVSDDSSGPTPAYYDGEFWRRTGDNAKVTALPLNFVINGQSNAAAGPPVAYNYSALTRYYGADILGWYDSGSEFVPVIDGTANAKAANALGGPGLGQVGTLLARRLADATGKVIRTFALAKTSQAIDYFLPASATKAYYEDSTQHATLNNYNLLKSYITASGVTPSLYVFIQGEANAGATKAAYKASLQTLIDALHTDYPSMKVAIVGTLGNAQHRLVNNDGLGGPTLAGVFAAQREVCEANPDFMLFIDNRDMLGNTAWYGGKIVGNHYTTYAGYEEVAERIFTTLQGKTRPAVAPVVSFYDALEWTQYYYNIHSIVDGNVSAWQGAILAQSLAPNTNAPAHTAYDPNFGNRTVLDFDGSNSETMKITGLPATSDWTLFAVALVSALDTSQCLLEIKDASSANRQALLVVGQSNAITFDEDGTDYAFDDAPSAADAIVPHSYLVTFDNTNQLVSLYVDGVLNGTHSLVGQAGMTELWVGSFQGAAQYFTGQCPIVAYAQGVIGDEAAAAKCHAWAKAEFKL